MDNPGVTRIGKKTTAQSMSVSEDEKLTIEVLAASERMKPAAFVREIFYCGIERYLREGRKVHAEATDEELFGALSDLIAGDEGLQKIKGIVEARRGLTSPPEPDMIMPVRLKEERRKEKNNDKPKEAKRR